MYKKRCGVAAWLCAILLLTGCGAQPEGMESVVPRATTPKTTETLGTAGETQTMETEASTLSPISDTTTDAGGGTTATTAAPTASSGPLPTPPATTTPTAPPTPTQGPSQEEAAIAEAVERLNAALDKIEGLQQLHFSYLSERWYSNEVDEIYMKDEDEVRHSTTPGQKGHLHYSHSFAHFMDNPESHSCTYMEPGWRYSRLWSSLRPEFMDEKDSYPYDLADEKPLRRELRFGDNGVNPEQDYMRNGPRYALTRLSPETATAVEEKNGETILRYQAVPVTFNADDQYGGKKYEHTAAFTLSEDGYLLSLQISYTAHCVYSDWLHQGTGRNVGDIQETLTFTFHNPGQPVEIVKPDWAAALD